MKSPNAYKELPEGYVAVKTVDAKGDKKFAIWMNVAALLLGIAGAAVAFWLKFIAFGNDSWLVIADNLMITELYLIVSVILMLVYTVLHELVHGAVYKIMTHEKLTFGVSWSCAYCGVPGLYVTRKTALVSLLAPFTVFNIIFITLIVLLDGLPAISALVLFTCHFGGCAGDLYDTFLLLFKLRGDVLINDDGPKQVFYKKQD